MINSFLSFQTFRGKETQSVGCGLYLLSTSDWLSASVAIERAVSVIQ